MDWDCAIIGGGPAGLSAALMLGRSQRSVLLLDDHKPRNSVTEASHGYLTRDGIAPAEFRSLASNELAQYPSVRLRKSRVVSVERVNGGFRVYTAAGGSAAARTVLLAAGLQERFPDIPGLREMYGKSLFSCPYCDGWELRGQPLLTLSTGSGLFQQARLLLGWSRDLLVCSHGSSNLTMQQRHALESRGVKVSSLRIAALEGSGGKLREVVFEDGSRIARSGGFASPDGMFGTPLGSQLGCAHDAHGSVSADGSGRTSVPGVYAAGDTAGFSPSQIVVAAASGTRAAVGIIGDLAEIDFMRMGG